jgi:hypothetical protein
LILVMVVVVMISLAGMSFVVLMSTENKAVHLRGDELEAQCLLGSGEESIKALLELDDEKRGAAGGTWDNPDRFHGVVVLGKESKRRGRFSVLSPRSEDGKITGVRWGLDSESARLNLAVLPDWERRVPGSARAALLNLPGMTESIADAILDWLDADGAQRQFGAEADYYAGLQLPYAPRNATPGCLEELLLVKGVTRALLFGADANFNYQTEPGESRGAKDAGVADGPPWASLVTLYSAERNLAPDGKPRIDLNQQDLRKLHQQLTGALGEEQAQFMILYRQFGPGAAQPDVNQGPAAPKPSVRLDLSLPGKVKFETVLDAIDVRVEVPGRGAEKPVVVASPFADDPTAMGDYLPKLLEQTTVVPGPVIRGRVNVDLAPREVLLGVPGMDEATVGRIVASRGSRGSPGTDSTPRHATWLLTDGLVDLNQMKKLLPCLTVGGDVYRGQVIGFYDRSGPIARAELVVDATGRPPRRVYWKDLRLFGPGYSREFLGGEEE